MDALKEYNELKARVAKVNQEVASWEGRREEQERRKALLRTELKGLGVDPDHLEEEKERLEKELAESFSKVEEEIVGTENRLKLLKEKA